MKKNNCIWILMSLIVGLVSCEKDPEIPVGTLFNSFVQEDNSPGIYICQEEGYVQNGDMVNVNTSFNFGFVMFSSAQTGKELALLILKIDDENPDTLTLTGNEYTYKGTLCYELTRDEIIGHSTITAIVADAAGRTATTSIHLSICNPSQPLETIDFEWYRLGNTQTGLEEYGLYWEKNVKETHAQIKPLDGVTLYSFSTDKWEAVTTDIEKAAIFAANVATPINVYNNVSATAGGTYNDVIGTKMADGTLHLINVTKCVIGAFQTQGYPITISGQAK